MNKRALLSSDNIVNKLGIFKKFTMALIPMLCMVAAPSIMADVVKVETGPTGIGPIVTIQSKDDQSDQSIHHHAQGHDHVNFGTDVVVDKPTEGSVVTFLGNSTVNADVGDSVVTFLGNSVVSGVVKDSVVSILGDAAASQLVQNSVVAVLGNVTVNGEVNDSTVAVLGSVNLGPKAVVHGSAVAIGGQVHREDGSQVDQSINSIGGFIDQDSTFVPNLKAYIVHAVLLGRPMAIGPHLAWIWIFAAVVLAFYLLTAAIMPKTLQRSTDVLINRPGMSFLTSLISIIGIPLTGIFLLCTIIGIPVFPFYLLSIFLFSIFGRIVVMAAIGTMIFKIFHKEQVRPIWLVLAGSCLVLALYLVPIIGYIVMHLIGFFGMGAVLLTLFQGISKPKQTSLNNEQAASVAAEPSSAEKPEMDRAAQDESVYVTSTDVVVTSETPASFSQRMLALIIDVICVNILMGGLSSFFREGGRLDESISFPNLIPLAIYAALLWHYRGTTAGGVIMKLKVERKDGLPMDLKTSSIRALACFLSLFAAGLGFFWILRDENREGWHDKIAGTRVVVSEKPMTLV